MNTDFEQKNQNFAEKSPLRSYCALCALVKFHRMKSWHPKVGVEGRVSSSMKIGQCPIIDISLTILTLSLSSSATRKLYFEPAEMIPGVVD